jgi:hypothetical protein
VTSWKTSTDFAPPFWSGYRELLGQLPADGFPGVGVLNSLLQPETCNETGDPIRFVDALAIPEVSYERHIYETGQVSTRANSWHDLFNALAWCRFPRLKSALNAMHYRHAGDARDGRRGAVRDGLTLLDESGAILVSSNPAVLQALADRDWQQAFVALRETWREQTCVFVCGHALLEKFLEPYKSITAHVLLFYRDSTQPGHLDAQVTDQLDAMLAGRLARGDLVEAPTSLSPLPLMGIPGWWPFGSQSEAFYSDPEVFRAPRSGSIRVDIHRLEESEHPHGRSSCD